MQKSKKPQEETLEHPYKFQINELGTLKFAVKGAKVIKAILEINGVAMSLLKPKYDDNWNVETITELNFFGAEKFLYRGLIPDAKVFVTLICDVKTIPSMMIGTVSNIVNWTTVNDKEYIDEVTVGSAAGEKTLMLAYYKTDTGGICGYVAIKK